MLVEGVTITEEGAVAGVVVITVGDEEPVAGMAAVDAVSTDLTKEAQVVVAVDVVWVDLGFNIVPMYRPPHVSVSVFLPL